MSRPLSMEMPGGRFHVKARGNERKEIFREDRDRVHFLSLLGELPSRFGTVILAYVQPLTQDKQLAKWIHQLRG